MENPNTDELIINENEEESSELITDSDESEDWEWDESGAIQTSLQLMKKELCSEKPYSPEEEREMFEKLTAAKADEKEYKAIFDDICMHNMRLVVSVAAKYSKVTHFITVEDLVQSGYLGLRNAVSKFDLTLNYKFSTYAVQWIRQAIVRHVQDSEHVVRIPVHLQDAFRKWNKMSAAEKDALRENYKSNNFSTPDHMAQFMDYLLNPASLNVRLDKEDDDGIEFGDTIAADSNVEKEGIEKKGEAMKLLMIGLDEWAMSHNRQHKNSALASDGASYSESLKEIIIRRFGINNNNPEILEAIAKDYGVTKERIRQIEASFLKFMQKPRHKEALRDYADFCIKRNSGNDCYGRDYAYKRALVAMEEAKMWEENLSASA